MVDLQTVCCMCGDVGFADKLFRCTKCCHRFQHSYCSNYYREYGGAIQVCDWCQSEVRNSSKKPSSVAIVHNHTTGGSSTRSEYSSDHKEKGNSVNNSKNPSGVPSPRTATRRYKLLKDVMC